MISVIVCTYNRSEILKAALQSLAEMRPPTDLEWELLVVDNNSTDRTCEVVEEFAKTAPMAVRYILEKEQGLSHARNCGVRHANGEIIAFTDDDVTVERDWLANVKKGFERFDCMALAGKIVPVWPGPKPVWFSDRSPYKMSGAIVSFDLGDHTCETSRSPIGANMSFRGEAFQKYGFFRTDLGRSKDTLLGGEEIEFSCRLRNGGEKTVYEPKAVVFHPVEEKRIRKSYFLSWHFHCGRAEARMEGIPKEAVCYFGVPRYVLREMGEHFVRWIVTFEPKRRFFHKLQVWLIAGWITENYRFSRGKGQEALQDGI